MSALSTTSIEEFLQLPDPENGWRLELHHGEIVTVPPPKKKHTTIQMRLMALLSALMTDSFVAGTEIPFRAPSEFWIADVAIVEAGRWKEETPDDYLHGSPELVIEVSSPGNTWEELIEKRRVCLTNGCLSFWIVDPKFQEVHVTDQNYRTLVYSQDAVIPVVPVAGSIVASSIFT